MDQSIDTLEVHEGPEVDDVRDVPLDYLSGFQLVEDLLASLLALLLEDRAAREDDVVALAIDLDHLALEHLAHELVQILDPTDIDQRCGEEAPDSEVEDEASLDHLDHLAFYDLARIGSFLDLAPCLLEPCALLGEDQASLLILLGQDESINLLAELDLFAGIHRLADREFARRYDALRLVADVYEYLVLVDPDHLAMNHVALLEGLDRGVVVGYELAVDLDQEVVTGACRHDWAFSGRRI